MPEGLDIHIVTDNCASGKAREVRNRFAKRLRRHVHFPPTYSSWRNQVGRFFVDPTDKRIGRGVHRSRVALEQAVSA